MYDIETASVQELVQWNEQGLIIRRQVPEYQVWCDMKHRCSNSNYNGWHNYGGRGIRVCTEWQRDFWAWLRYMGRRPPNWSTTASVAQHSIDRIDNNGNYEPGNVRWATIDVQTGNQIHWTGEDHGLAKLTWEKVREIRSLHGVVGITTIALDYELSESSIWKIMHNEAWVDPNYNPLDVDPIFVRGEAHGKALVSVQEVIEILKLIEEDRYSSPQIGALYNLSKSAVDNIKYGHAWSWLKPTEAQLAAAVPRRPKPMMFGESGIRRV